ncbi:MAG: polyprenyl synthetase family protein [Candidatus Micrarchaeota archaeon]|nr:polyprenyl synthetase family protein [Candidatus Micrarchaeota archaeon]
MEKDLERSLRKLTRPVRDRMRRLFEERRKPYEVYGLLSEFLSEEGKLIRPALCLCSCLAVGGKIKDAVPAATAIEMFHNFTLIHDDIEDCSSLRRGKPCLHVKYGVPLALNAGDGLFMMVWKEALALKGPVGVEAQRLLLSAFTKVLEGQAIELGWYRTKKWDVKQEEYYEVVRGKTGALIAVSCEVGALLGGATKAQRRALYEFGLGVGVSFQIVDDILNVVGDESKYGKEIGGDIKEGKRTLLTIFALENLERRKVDELRRILEKKERTQDEVRRALCLIKESGAVEQAGEIAGWMAQKALGKLKVLGENEGARMLRLLGEYIIKRQK